MNVLFLTILNIKTVLQHGIYTDLMREFHNRGDNVHIACAVERRNGMVEEFALEAGIKILRIRTGNITQTNILEKGLSTILIERQFISAIKKYFSDVKFDLVVYSTPPVTFGRVVSFIKRRDGCSSYLILKDIFPQNAVDLGMMKKGSVLWRYFRGKEKKLYALSDYIGCMSRGNMRYVLEHNPDVSAEKLEVLPNSINPNPLRKLGDHHLYVRQKYNIPKDSVLFVYGGNLGKPQGIDFLLQFISRIKERKDIFLLIAGSGTEYGKIEAYIKAGSYPNTRLMEFIPKKDYDMLVEGCDAGLIFLDPRFTIPNFPSRLTSYMEAAIPVAAATDENTDLKDVLYDSGCGMWAKSGDMEGFMHIIDTLASDKDLRYKMGLAGRSYLEENYTVSRGYEIIMSHFKNNRGVDAFVQ